MENEVTAAVGAGVATTSSVGGTVPSVTTREATRAAIWLCGNNVCGNGGTQADPWLLTLPPLSLVMLKCLKPMLECKICWELLVVTHCMQQGLPNLAHLIGVALPDLMDRDKGGASNNDANDVCASHKLRGGEEGGGMTTQGSLFNSNGRCGSCQRWCSSTLALQ
jgi:hypothetical protein